MDPNQYQSLGEKAGSSNSQGKWDAMKLSGLEGIDVLDLGCNEGFFVEKFIEGGARRTVGVDTDAVLIDKAKDRVPRGEFLCMSWEDYLDECKDEAFDLVIMLSALHYSKNYRNTLSKIRRVLKKDGTLVLEASIYPSDLNTYIPVNRGHPPFTDLVYHMTPSKLMSVADGIFGIRLTGPSIDQPGDPVKRFMYKLRPAKPYCILLSGKSGSGKTRLADTIAGDAKRLSTISTDLMVIMLKESRFTDLAKKISENWIQGRIDLAYDLIIEEGHIDEFVGYIVRNLDTGGNTLVEGTILQRPEFRTRLVDELTEDFEVVEIDL